jgi:hypothetical protein
MGASTGLQATSTNPAEYTAAMLHRAAEMAIERNSVQAFYAAIHQGADPNRRNAAGETLFERAIALQRLEAVGFLRSMGEASAELPTSKGSTPLTYARELRAALDGSDQSALDAADGIVEMLEDPRRAQVFRLAYNAHLERLEAKASLRGQGRNGLLRIAFFVAMHLLAFAWPDSKVGELLEMSPFLHVLNRAWREGDALMQTTGLAGVLGRKEEL